MSLDKNGLVQTDKNIVDSRIGCKIETIEEEDLITKRLHVDEVVNEHGRTPLDLLCDNSLCVLTGRFRIEPNRYTSISTRGSTVVDYAIVRQSDVHLL